MVVALYPGMCRTRINRNKVSLYAAGALLVCQIAMGASQGGGGGGGCSIPFIGLRRSLPYPGGDVASAPVETPKPAPSSKPGALEFSLLGQDGETLVPVSTDGVIDLGTLTYGKELDHTVVVTNTGGTRVERIGPNVLAVPYSFAGEQYPGTGGDCDFALAAKAQCKLVIRVSGKNQEAPSAAKAFEQDLELEYAVVGFGVLGKASAKLNATLTPIESDSSPVAEENVDE